MGHRYRRRLPLWVGLMLVLSSRVGAASTPVYPRPMAAAETDQIRTILTRPKVSERFAHPGEVARNWGMLQLFYAENRYAPAWNRGGGFSPNVGVLLDILEHAGDEGLDPGIYPVDEIWAALDSTDIRNPRQLAERDIMISYLFLTYAGHLSRGRLDAAELRQNWFIGDPNPDLARVLEAALGPRGVRRALEDTAPAYPGYRKLRAALARYRGIAASGGWPRPGGRFKVALGDSSAHVREVRAHLAGTGDLPDTVSRANPAVFDEGLDAAVRRFQARHGLMVDGVVGPRTLTEMGVTAEERVRTILANLERWRWLPDTLSTRYVMVNLPQFELHVVEQGDTVMTMRVVVGTDVNATPSFQNKIQYIETSPQWNVPKKIAAEEVVLKAMEDPEYLARQNFTVFDSTGAEVDPESVVWKPVSPDSLAYRFRQEPGPLNPLGSIKFMFPNRFSIYLHDTSNPGLFKRSERDFSHGCVRIEKPVEFAEYVLRGDDRWSRKEIEAAMKSDKTRRIDLPEPIPIYLLYWTAFVDGEGRTNFRRDLYGHDEVLETALNAYHPADLRPSIFLARLAGR